jgi:lipopolysaccharide heptosyltransferase I
MQPITLPAPPASILIIKPSAIGDVVHGLPILSLLRRKWPEAKISWLVTPACAGILDRHPMLHEVIHFDRRAYAKAWRNWRTFKSLRAFARGLRDRRFDLAIDLQGLLRSGWLARATRAPVRVGLSDAREGARIFYTHRVPTALGAPGGERHAIERYLCVTEALGCGREPVEFPFPTDDADRAHVAALLPPSPYAVLMPGTNWETKRWPVERFAALVAPLRERFGLESIVAGGPADADLAAPIECAGALNLAGKTTLRQLVALLERAAVVVANDSGPMHIAAALGRPLVAPFGPTSPVRTGPYRRMDSVIRLDIPCSPCFSRTCSHQSCLRWLETAPVLELAEQQMAAGSGS